MRSVLSRSVVLLLSVSLAAGAFAGPRTEPSQSRGVRTVKSIIRALGDLITVPIPAPAPPPKEP